MMHKTNIPDAWYEKTVVDLVPFGSEPHVIEDDVQTVVLSCDPELAYAKTILLFPEIFS